MDLSLVLVRVPSPFLPALRIGKYTPVVTHLASGLLPSGAHWDGFLSEGLRNFLLKSSCILPMTLS